MTESASGEVRYLLSDGLSGVRHVTDEAGQLVSTHEFDPYGVPLTEPAGDPYGYTGEWWQADIGLLHLRARWYEPHSGTFLSRDAVESEPPYQYVRGNVINRVDPSGYNPCLAPPVAAICAKAAEVAAATLIATYVLLTSEPAQEAIGDLVESFPANSPPIPYPPGFTLEQAELYHFETPALAVPPLELTFPEGMVESLDPCVTPNTLLDLPNIMVSSLYGHTDAFRFWWDNAKIRKRAIFSLTPNQDTLDELAERFIDAPVEAWRKTGQYAEIVDEYGERISGELHYYINEVTKDVALGKVIDIFYLDDD